jgi:hypothetical protein
LTEHSYLPPTALPSNGSRKKLIAIIVIITVIVAVVVGVFFLTKGGSSSLSPTGTPTPTPSVTQSPSPTQTPTEVANVVVLSASDYYDGSGRFNIVGEVQNTLGTNVKYVKIVVTFYDSNGAVIAADYTNTEIDILKPNQKSPFKLTDYLDNSLAGYSLDVQYNTTQDQPFEGLTIVNQTASIDPQGLHNIVGKVKNNGACEATHVIVVGTYYNSAGKVIGISFTYTDPATINAGATSSFALTSYPLAITPARYELQVQGQ